ncbi:signal peptidase I [uncultured Eubacterium sp.]|uniref:signal peptidase I n=1 Tax=uncultured Eubacterium sp. TaxID=165185 RepID=UPI0025E4F48F|nr:signal peptidase I [uncultured Eubacterium sp.]
MEEILRSRRNGRKGNRNSKRSMRPVSESLRGQWRWFLIRLLILIGILYVLFGCIFGITTVKNEDMDPRISAGDLVLYYRLDKKPVAGDVIICKKNGKQYVGRVVGKGGDSVEVTEEATVKVNGSIVLDQNIFYETPQYESEVKYPLQLQEGECFILGDHREGATDSRYFGAVDTQEIRGKIITVIRRNQL